MEQDKKCKNCKLMLRWVLQHKPRKLPAVYGWEHVQLDGRLTPRWCFPFDDKCNLFAEPEESTSE